MKKNYEYGKYERKPLATLRPNGVEQSALEAKLSWLLAYG